MRREKILIYGGSGLVGSELVKAMEKDFDVDAPSHKDVDLLNKNQFRDHIAASAPDHMIYAAGVTNVDQAEQQPTLAFLLNAETPRLIAEIAASRRIPVHYLSTNAVFDGQQSHRPYRENDVPHPPSVYGKSKLKGEQFVIQASPLNLVLRTVMPYSSSYPRKKDFTRIVLDSLQQQKQIEGIVDQIINPIYVKTFVRAIKKILEERASGIYHLAAVDWTTNDDFARKVAKTFGFNDTLIIPNTLTNFYKDKSGVRTPYYWLDTGKFRREFGEGILKTLDEDLALFKKDYGSRHKSTSTRTRAAISRA